jgi:hypothetical protein
MSQETSTRVQQALEQIGEDESLTSDLTDPAATALLDWIGQQIRAADAATDDVLFRQQVMAIRSAARSAAKSAADEELSAAVVLERASTVLSAAAPAQQTAVPAEEPGESAPLAAEAHLSIPVSAPAAEAAQPPQQKSLWNSLRRRVRRWTHRKG